MNGVTDIRKFAPNEAVEHIHAALKHETEWLDAFAGCLDRRLTGQSLAWTLEVWDLSQAEAARHFGVSRQAIGKWLHHGVPPGRSMAISQAISDLAAATDLLVRYLKRDRVPAVVRRPIPALDEVSLMGLLQQGDTRRLLATCRDMFRFEHAYT